MIDAFAKMATVDSPVRNILLIRHAEKLTWPSGNMPAAEASLYYEDDHQLSAKGFERSHALVGYFLHRKEILDIYARTPLAEIVYQGVDLSGSGKSERPKQTVVPLMNAMASGGVVGVTGHGNTESVRIAEFKKNQFDTLVTHLRTSPTLNEKCAIVSWSHQTLPELAHALGVPSKEVPKKWGKRFDVTWLVRIGGGTPATLTQMPQNLLFGDENEPIKMKGGFQVKDPVDQEDDD
ncbi:hypothetical protein BJ741DRAFT_605272 [Chytriomyces cf. hyalinus JEL632]|nr:hypothetical protein BJ741DRAFT_605272 [Chytriomyces cf. hyalinus JEL632]